MIEILGYLAAIVIGFTLGLIGGGGSILTVPVLVYLVGINPVLSTAYSLFVVGTSSLVGAFDYMRKGLLSYKTAVVFAVPSFIAVFLTRRFLMPVIPQELFVVSGFVVTKDVAINYPLIILEGAVVGVLTGIVGAGGGFLIIPALVLLARLPIKLAVGTSLLIIAAKSLIGFLGDVGTQPMDWNFLLIFTAMATVGIFLGGWASRFVPGSRLKAGFGWFVLVMGMYIIGKELFF